MKLALWSRRSFKSRFRWALYVSELSIEHGLRWERNLSTPAGKANGLSIMTQAPLGGSNYGNEYGRPTLAGYFRTLCCVKDGIEYGYHKPLMLAGGWGEINADQLNKKITDPAALLIVLGEPALTNWYRWQFHLIARQSR